jgi:dihydrolipoamide dehydrogenase
LISIQLENNMAKTIEIKVPDIGGFDQVPVIEVLVSTGDTVAKDDSLVTLESDKATVSPVLTRTSMT